MSSFRTSLLVLVGVVLLPAVLEAQENGTVTGTVLEATTQRPLQGAQIVVVGTQIGTISNQLGRFIIPAVPAGPQEIRASLIGFGQATRAVTVVAGQSANVEIALQETAVAIDEVVVTATGQTERRRETGNVVSTINVGDVPPAAVASLPQLLTARAPGVIVQNASGTTGTTQRIRIRGSNSISLSNQPLLIVDGMRVNNSSMGMGTVDLRSVWVGGQETSRWNDLSPDEIENIEILKGPAASALYGTAAANGVIQITTRRGRAGETRWNFFTEAGRITENTDFPANFQRIGTRNDDGTRTTCVLEAEAFGFCEPKADSLYSYNPLEADSPFRDGWRVNHGLNVSGGSEQVTYFLGAELEREQGVLEPNILDKVNLRANVRTQLRDDLSATLTTGYITSRLNLPQGDNNGFSPLVGGLLGNARNLGENEGWFSGDPAQFYIIEAGQDVNRFTGGLDLQWVPRPWLSVIGQAGLDQSNNEDFEFVPAGFSDYSVLLEEGYRRINRVTYSTINGNLSATATRPINAEVQSSTSIGTMYTSERQQGTFAFGRQLLPGTGALGGAAAGFEVDETRQEIVTVGAYARQQFAWRDRLFLTASLRGDDNSTFGQEFAFVTYPAASLSWVMSEEPFFPELSSLSSFRVRAAYGQSGQRPGFRQATTFFTPVSVTIGDRETTAITIGGTGNAELEPERSSEIEIGFDAGLLDDRVGLEVTYYDRTTRDALIARRLAPSIGATQERFENVAQVSNSGWEAQLTANLLNQDRLRWDVNLTASANRNNLDKMGLGVEDITFNSENVQRHREGYPLGSYFAHTYTFSDVDSDGIITQEELEISEDVEFLGTPFPKFEMGITNDFTLLEWLRISGHLDYKSGHRQFNYTRFYRCVLFTNCQDVHDPSTSLEDQAAVVAASMVPTPVTSGLVEDATFLKLRELSFTLDAPSTLASRISASGLSLTLAGRNLWSWSRYSGFDPEVNSSPYAREGNFDSQDFFGMPAVQYWTARVNVNF